MAICREHLSIYDVPNCADWPTNPTHPDHAYRAMRDRRSSPRSDGPAQSRGAAASPSLDYVNQAKADRDPAGSHPPVRGRIAVGTRHMLLEHMPAGKLRLSEVNELFELLR